MFAPHHALGSKDLLLDGALSSESTDGILPDVDQRYGCIVSVIMCIKEMEWNVLF